MKRRVHHAPGDPDGDKAPWDVTHPKVRAARRDAETAGKRPAQAVLDRLNRARGKRGDAAPQRPPPSPELELGGGDAEAYDAGRADAFWGAPTTDEGVKAVTNPDEFLSGAEELFDPATGWDFNAITDSNIPAISNSQMEAARAPAAPTPHPEPDSGEFAVEISDDDVPPITVDDALARAQDLFKLEREGEGLRLLGVASQLAPDDPRIATWLEYGERRVMRRLCPSGALDRVPQLTHPLDTLIAASPPDLAGLLHGVDGVANAGLIRSRMGLDAATFWKGLGRLVERGWIAWLDDA